MNGKIEERGGLLLNPNDNNKHRLRKYKHELRGDLRE